MSSFLKFLFLSILPCLIFTIGCGRDDDMKPKIIEEYGDGVYIVNRGFESEFAGDVSFHIPGCAQGFNYIFQKANGTELPGLLMDLAFLGDNTVLLLLEDQLIFVDSKTFELTGTITGFTNAREIEIVNPLKAYITRWNELGVGPGLVVVNLFDKEITTTIGNNRASDGMIASAGAIYVAQSGGTLIDSTIAKYDATTETLIKTIEVGKRPVSFVQDNSGALWVLCEGYIANTQNIDDPENVKSRLVKLVNDEIALDLELGVGAKDLMIDPAKQNLYIVNKGWIYKLPVGSTSLPSTPWLARSFSSHQIDPVSDIMYTTDARDFRKEGTAFSYALSTADTLYTFRVGRSPLDIKFK